MIYTDKFINDKGYLNDKISIDLEVGLKDKSRNDFELTVPLSLWDKSLNDGSIIYDDDKTSEFGGMILGKTSNTSTNDIVFYGKTWRGIIDTQVIEPTQGQTHYKARGDANAFLRDVLDNYFNGLIVGSSEVCGVNVNRDIRFINKLEAIEKTLSDVGLRIDIDFDIRDKKAIVKAVPIETHHEKEFSNDYGISLIAKDIQNGFNHCICLGKGELLEREVIHLYKLSDGKITQDKTQALNDGISGINDRCMIYDNNNAEDTQALIDGGIKALNEKSDTKSLEIQNVDNIAIGDVVGARDRFTNIYMQKSIIAKIVRGYINNITIENKVGE